MCEHPIHKGVLTDYTHVRRKPPSYVPLYSKSTLTMPDGRVFVMIGAYVRNWMDDKPAMNCPIIMYRHMQISVYAKECGLETLVTIHRCNHTGSMYYVYQKDVEK